MNEEEGATDASRELPTDPAARTTIDVSSGFAELLRRLAISIAFTSYQTGQLFLVGVEPTGTVSIDQQRFERAMGLHWDGRRLFLATASQVIRFENMLLPGEIGDDRNDAILVPRLSWTTGDVDAHEIATDGDGTPLFVATHFNCIATVDEQFSFRRVWMPNFIEGLAGEDKCHLNGLAVQRGRLAFVTLAGRTDVVDGWRDTRVNGGEVLDCRTNTVVAGGLSMPHSPRCGRRSLWYLESGRGWLKEVDPTDGTSRNVAFCPGFARGLAIGSRHALVTVSRPRDIRFDGLPLGEALEERGLEPWCGVLVIDLRDGSIPGWLRLDGPVRELFDVAAMPGIRCPRSLGPHTLELGRNVRPHPEPGSSSNVQPESIGRRDKQPEWMRRPE